MQKPINGLTRQQRIWTATCVLGMVLWIVALVLGDHRSALLPGGNTVSVVLIATLGGVLWAGAGWRAVQITRRLSATTAPLPLGKAALWALGMVALVQEGWIIMLVVEPTLVSARVLAETNLLVGATATLGGLAFWSRPPDA
jgi:hypothetical protein